jgi:hypothetical protein
VAVRSFPGRRREANEYDADATLAARVDELTEVLVLGQQHIRALSCDANHFDVFRALRYFRYHNYVVAGTPERTYGREIAAFIREEAHGFPVRISERPTGS